MKALKKTYTGEAIKKVQLSIPVSYQFYLIKRAADVSLAEQKTYNIQDVIRNLIEKDMEEYRRDNS